MLRRACALPIPAEGGVVTSYVHNAYAPGLGRTVAAVALRSQADPAALQALGTNLAMHIVAAAPRYLSRGEVDEAVLDRERSVLSEQAAASGKPAATIAKMDEQHGQSDPLAVPELGFSAFSGRAWRLWAAQHSNAEASPLGAQPLPRVLELAAAKAAHFIAFDHPVGRGTAGQVLQGGAHPNPNPNPNPDPNPNPSPDLDPSPNPNPNPNPNQVVLLEQEYIVEDKAGDVSKVLKKASADLGAEVTLEGFVRYQLGEAGEAESSSQ